MKTIISLIFVLLAVSCNLSKKEQTVAVYNAENALIVDSSCAIILLPDSVEIARMHAQHSKEEYESWAASVTWHPGIAASELTSLAIRNIPCHDKEFIVLRNAKKEEFILKRKDISEDIILFHVNKKPILIHSADFEENKEFVLRYFDKK